MDGEQTMFFSVSESVKNNQLKEYNQRTVTISFMEDFVSHVDIPTTRLLLID